MHDSSSDTLSPPTTGDGKPHHPHHPISPSPSPSPTQSHNDDGFGKDIEKGDPGSKENNEVDQGDVDKRQTKEENNLVGWDGPDDPENPQNWPRSKKYTVTIFYASMTFCLTFASSVFSTATMVTAKLFGVSSEVMTLGTSLFVLV